MEFAGYVIIVLLIFCLVVLGYIIRRVIINERKKTQWLRTVKDGDDAEIHAPSPLTLTGSVKYIGGDEYDVVVRVNKRFLYPPKGTTFFND